MQCYQIVSAVCGAIFIIGIWRIARYLYATSALLPFVIMLSSGITGPFFGYIESYSIIAALLPFIFLAGLKACGDRKYSNQFILLFFIACLVHSVAFFLFAPAFIVIIVRRLIDTMRPPAIVLRFLLMFLSVIVILAYFLIKFDVGSFGRYLVPLTGSSNSDNYILGARHWLDIFNWIALVSIPLFVLIPAILRKINAAINNPDNLFAFSVIIACLFFIIFFNPQLGAARDWDLFSLPIFLILLASLAIYRKLNGYILPSSIIAVTLLSLSITASFVIINNSLEKSTRRFADLLRIENDRNLFNEYNLLSAYASDHHEIENRWLEFASQAWNQPPQNKGDSILILNKLGEYYMNNGNIKEALKYLEMSLKADSLNLLTYHYLINLFRRLGDANGQMNLALLMEQRLSENARGLMDAGQLFCQLGNLDKGGDCLTRAYNLDSNDVFVMVNYGVYHFRRGNLPTALTLLKKAVTGYPDYFAANYNLSLVYLSMGDKANAYEYLKQAARLASNASDSNQVANILSRLK